MSAVRFTAKQVLEQIFSNDSDCDEDADEEASEEEDGEEYNPEDEETTEDDDDYDAAAVDAADDEDEDDVQIEDIILEMTNLEGVRKYGARGDGDDGDDDHRHYADDDHHEVHEDREDRDRDRGCGRWKAMDSTDLRAYVGLLILAGVYRSRGEAASSLWDAESGRTIFRATMPLKVFHAYSRLLRFDDRQTRAERRAAGGGDKLAAVREVWDKWVERLPLLYNPGADVTVDEQLVPFRGRCPFRQYIPSKPAKYGIKTWVACDSKSSYAWKMQVYTGKATCGGPEKNQGMRVVLDLTQGLRGHNVTCDNFFTSYELARQLLTRNVTVVGTVRKNKPELPQALLASKDRLLFSSKFAFTPTTALVSYLAKKNKNVLLLSTLHTEAHVSRRQDKKPAIVLDYNSNKGGVDNLDKVIGTYSCRRMTARWPLVIFHNILDVSSYNAFVIWRELNPTWMPGKRNKRRVFLEQLGKALVTPFIQRRARLPRTEASAALVKAVQRATYRDQPRRDHAPRSTGPRSTAGPSTQPRTTQ
ncbi:piggyBac transposable element-derived protein 4-like [Coregonus clupeaformis]|uniref:piggyBac transposable element-derived protein 4-like n=1 Tax=Coregonus clupeaformis TaxID=59861 RepID=UPI001E1C3AFF|nr:piggyBac transposable element-derived protein 4-like [Coregonus clupeaformis]